MKVPEPICISNKYVYIYIRMCISTVHYPKYPKVHHVRACTYTGPQLHCAYLIPLCRHTRACHRFVIKLTVFPFLGVADSSGIVALSPLWCEQDYSLHRRQTAQEIQASAGKACRFESGVGERPSDAQLDLCRYLSSKVCFCLLYWCRPYIYK